MKTNATSSLHKGWIDAKVKFTLASIHLLCSELLLACYVSDMCTTRGTRDERIIVPTAGPCPDVTRGRRRSLAHSDKMLDGAVPRSDAHKKNLTLLLCALLQNIITASGSDRLSYWPVIITQID